jgi:hypothetical protein
MESEDVCALERLLAKKRQAGRVLLDMDFYERYGAQHDSDQGRAEKQADAMRAETERAAAVEELTALVARLRRENPAAVERWAELHDELLRAAIDRYGNAAADSRDSTAAYVAGEERAAWQAVKRGEQPFVDENVFYVRPDDARYLELFGISF